MASFPRPNILPARVIAQRAEIFAGVLASPFVTLISRFAFSFPNNGPIGFHDIKCAKLIGSVPSSPRGAKRRVKLFIRDSVTF